MPFKDTRWQTLSIANNPRTLADASREHTISVKLGGSGPYDGWLLVKLHAASAGWSHLALSPEQTLVAQGYGDDEGDSFAMLRSILDVREARASRSPVRLGNSADSDLARQGSRHPSTERVEDDSTLRIEPAAT